MSGMIEKNGFFSEIKAQPPNSVLGLSEECKADKFPDKINLTIGAYRDEKGNPYVLKCVREAELKLIDSALDHEYLSQDGLPSFLNASQVLMFGEASDIIKNNRLYSIQCVAGTGALRLAFEFVNKSINDCKVFIPDVTWQNHPSILKELGTSFATYNYLDSSGLGFDFDGMMTSLQQSPKGSIILLHSCAHNPTGIDPTEEQWRQILKVVQERELFPFFDNAYQGFVSGDPDVDAFAVRLFAEAGVELMVACSFSKNFGLYGERLGVLHTVTNTPEQALVVASNLRAVARTLYSTCPTHAARIVSTILNDPVACPSWKAECAGMAERLRSVRELLVSTLEKHRVKGTWTHIVQQRGMFSYSGIPAWAAQRLKEEHHIYMLASGRISLAGLNLGNIERFASCLAEVMGKNE